MMDAICFFETPIVFQRTSRRYTPGDSSLRNQRCENLKSYMAIYVGYLKTLSSRICIVDARMINEYGAIGGMRIVKGNQSTRRNLQRCPSQIPCGLERNWGRRGGKLATNGLTYDMACIRHKNS
jgi:hypothetical protein